MKRKIPDGKRFVKGQSGNPKGSSERKRTMRDTARLTAEQVHEVAAVILHGNQDDLKALAKDPKSTVLQMWTASLVTKSIQKGDAQVFRVLMERLLGRPRESITLSSDPGAPVVVQYQSSGEKLERIEALRRARETVGED